MTAQLLFDAGQLQTIVIVAACVLVALAFLYGVIKKFSRMSWLGWQTALLFAATLPLSFLPETQNGTLLFCLAAGGLLAVTALVFLAGAVLRKPFLALEAGAGGRALNRILGGVTGVFNIAVFAAIFGGLALVCAEPYNVEFLNIIYTHPVWTNFAAGHAFDLFFVFMFALFLRWGYRTGFLRMIVTLTVLTLTLFAVFLSMYMTLQVPFLSSFAAQIAGAFPMNEIAAGWIGFGIVSFIVAFVFLLVIILIAFVLNLLLKAAGKSHAFVVFDGILFSLVTFVILFVCVIGVNFGVGFIASGAISEALPEQMAGVAEALTQSVGFYEKVVTSSPLSNIFYSYNPLLLLI